jgi:hypothetical protein
MSSSSAHPSSSSSSSSPSSQSDTLQLENIVKDHSKDTLSYPADIPSPLLHKDTPSRMPPDRSRGRDVHIFDAHDRNTSIGGLVLTAGITNANLHAMIEIFVIFTSECSLQSESNVTIAKDDNSPLLPGNYYIFSSGKSVFSSLFL